MARYWLPPGPESMENLVIRGSVKFIWLPFHPGLHFNTKGMGVSSTFTALLTTNQGSRQDLEQIPTLGQERSRSTTQ